MSSTGPICPPIHCQVTVYSQALNLVLNPLCVLHDMGSIVWYLLPTPGEATLPRCPHYNTRCLKHNASVSSLIHTDSLGAILLLVRDLQTYHCVDIHTGINTPDRMSLFVLIFENV